MVQPIRPHDASGIYRRQVTSAEAVEAAQNARRNAAAAGRRIDQVTVSEGAREFARIMDAVKEAPDARASRVEDLRARIESGQYEVDYFGLANLLHDRGVGS
ncbi:MAG: flagellar biosynthesis anti-sigma factor FlgM [Dehalococcoidia bacterium]